MGNSSISSSTVHGEEQPGELVGRGRTAEVYHWGAQDVVKLFYSFMPLQTVEHEARVATALVRAALPAPRYGGRIQIDDRPGLLFERVEDRSMLDVLSGRPWLVLYLAEKLADLHLAIHRQPADADLPPLGRICGWRSRRHRTSPKRSASTR